MCFVIGGVDRDDLVEIVFFQVSPMWSYRFPFPYLLIRRELLGPLLT